MPPVMPSKVFNIPFLGGAATVVCLIKYSRSGRESTDSLSVQYNADGTTLGFGGGDLTLGVSVNDDVMTVKITGLRDYTITNCRCCLIPGDPFA